jgi:hypothetical protein
VRIESLKIEIDKSEDQLVNKIIKFIQTTNTSHQKGVKRRFVLKMNNRKRNKKLRLDSLVSNYLKELKKLFDNRGILKN